MGGTATPAQAASQPQTPTDDSSRGWDAASGLDQSSASAPAQASATPPAGQSATAQPSTPGQPAAPSATNAAPPPAPVAPVVTSNKRPGIAGVVDSIADALAGKTTPEIGTDANGNQYVKQVTQSRGQQWIRIGAGLVGDAAKGMAAGKGRNPGAAAAAGFDAGQQQQQQAAQQTGEAQKQILANANYQKLRMDTAEQAWHLSAMQHEATQHDVEFAQGQEDRLMKVDGANLLGTADSPNDIDKILKVDPNVMESMIKHHQIEILPHYNADGTAAGIRVFKMPDGYRKTIEPAGSTFHTFDSTTGQYVAHQTSEPITAGELDDYETAAANAAQKFKIDQVNLAKQQAETDKTKAETGEAKANTVKTTAEATKVPSEIAENKGRTAEAYSAAEKNRAEARQLNEATDGASIQSNAAQMVEGNIDPSQLSKRSKSYDATLAAANQYSLQKYGKPFNLSKAAADYKYATNVGTTNTLNYLNSLVGRDNQSGNLGKLVQLSNQLPRDTTFPPINDKTQWAKISAGNVPIAEYYAALTETNDQIAKILQGGNGGGTSDAKLRQASELMQKGFTAAQVSGVANNTLRPLLGNRKQEIIGDNRYLQQWHNPAPKPPAAPSPQTHVFNPTAWQQANPGKDVNQAIAVAKQQGYAVAQ